MADLFRRSGGVIGTMMPGTSWAAPNGLFPTAVRNDGSFISYNDTTATITLPASNLADGYLFRVCFETEDTSNGRLNIQGRFQQASGTGNFWKAQTSGYSRDTSEDRLFVQVVGFVDGPSASSTYQFEWKRETDAANASDGTVQSYIEVIPFYYSNVGMYSSTSTALLAGTTPNTVSLSSDYQSDTGAIEISGNTVTVKGNNKRYLIIGNVYMEETGGTRTQRVGALEYDGTVNDATRSYFYARSSSNAHNGMMMWDVYETATSDIGVELMCWQGDSVANDGGGAENAGSTPSTAYNGLLVIELNDSAEVFRSHDQTGLQSDSAGTPVDLNAVRTMDFNDSASFTRIDDLEVNVEQAMDAFIGGNIFTARQTISNTTRRTTRGHITKNGTEDLATAHGNYSRGDQSTSGTFAGGFQPGGFMALAANDDIGMSMTAISGTEAGNPRTQAGTVGLWGINLDTLTSSEGITGVVPSSFVMNASDVDIDGLNFEATQGTGAVYISDVTTLAGGSNEVDVSSAINTWSDTQVNMDFTSLSESELDDIHSLGPGAQYIILVNDSGDEYYYAITLSRPPAFVMSAGNIVPGATTSRLTGMTGTFTAGRAEEAANPSGTTTDAGTDGRTEHVLSIEATNEAYTDQVYEIALFESDNTEFDTYTNYAEFTPETASSAINLAATGLDVTVDIGDATLSPQSLGLSSTGLSVTVDIGNATLSPQPLNIAATSLDVNVDIGTATLDPVSAPLTATGFDITVDIGTATLTLGSVGLSTSSLDVNVDIGAASLSPQPLNFSSTGLDVNVEIGNAGLILGEASLAATGLDITVDIGNATLDPQSLDLVASGLDVTVEIGNATLDYGATQLAATGLDVTVDIGNATLTVQGEADLQATGLDVNVDIGNASLDTGSLNLPITGLDVTVDIGDATLTPVSAPLSVTGLDVTIEIGDASLDSGAIIVSATGLDVNIDIGDATLSPQSLDLNASGLDVTVEISDATLTVDSAPLSTTGLDVNVDIGDASLDPVSVNLPASSLDVDVEIGDASLTLDTAPLASTGLDVTVEIGNATIKEIQVLQTTGLNVTVEIGDITLTQNLGLYPSGLDVIVDIGNAGLLVDIYVPDSRKIEIEAKNREIIIEPFDRTISIKALNRVIELEALNRTIEFEPTNRTIIVGK